MLLAAEFDTLGAINEGRQAFPAGPPIQKAAAPAFAGRTRRETGAKETPAAASSYAELERADTGPVFVRVAEAAETTEKRGFL